jgi:hypothetical protein
MSMKADVDMNAGGRVDDLDHSATHATYFEKDEVVALSPEHQEYLIQRHGTVELDPLPTMSPADPYNWPQWKVWRLPNDGS